MRIVMGIMVFLLLGLQYKAWFGDAGSMEASALRSQVAVQRDRAELLAQRNRLLTAEVLALKAGYAAVEARARTDLGMIKQGETFYLVPERPPDEGSRTPDEASRTPDQGSRMRDELSRTRDE